MCKKINLFLPCLLFFYVAASIGVGRLLWAADMQLPLWASYIVSQSLLLLPCLVYTAVMRIHIPKCIPYRKMKPLDMLLSLLFGYALIPAVLLVNSISMLFSTNYLDSSTNMLATYPFFIQILLVAVIPPLVEEFAFRGLFYHSYRRNGILGAALMSGFVFGMFHLNFNQFCYAFMIGVLFALLVEATGSIWASVLAHFAINTYSISMMKLLSFITPVNEAVEQAGSLSDYPLPVVLFQMAVLAGIALGFLFIAFLLFKVLAKRSGRWEYMVTNVKKGLKPQNGERFVTLPAAAALVAAAAYMIWLEFV